MKSCLQFRHTNHQLQLSLLCGVEASLFNIVQRGQKYIFKLLVQFNQFSMALLMLFKYIMYILLKLCITDEWKVLIGVFSYDLGLDTVFGHYILSL